MAWFSKFMFPFALKLIFNGGQFFKKYQNLVIPKSGKKSVKLQKLNICLGKLIQNERLATMLNEWVSALWKTACYFYEVKSFGSAP